MKQLLLDVIGWPFKKRSSTLVFFYVFLIIGAFIVTRYKNIPTIAGTPVSQRNIPISNNLQSSTPEKTESFKPPPVSIQNNTYIPLKCIGKNLIQTCPKDYPARVENPTPSNQTCPSYFRWIHEDLRPWKANGIRREMVESVKGLAYFRLVVVDGKPYVEKYRGSYQTRDIFTVWGILQLLRLYPGRLPDLDIMFESGDKSIVKKENYTAVGIENAPPLFHYCGDDTTLDIAFPDWSFWGWPEINIKPWNLLKRDLRQSTKNITWEDRLPYAYWKGNPYMGDRMKLLDCNSTESWNTVIHTQNWEEETKLGFKTSNLVDQCNYRYKIYIEGIAWSVSKKYILACDSMALLVTPDFYEFFTRSLEPMKHYWPVNPSNICKSIKFAADWGNQHPNKAQKIGKTASKFVQHELKMEHVYDYMFHLLNEYGKLLRYKPSIPPGAMEVCSETLACSMEGLDRQFKMDSMVKGPSRTDPCLMSPNHDDFQETVTILGQYESMRKSVDTLVSQGDPHVDNF